MEKIALRLLGSFRVGSNIRLRRKNRAILAYLALSPQPLTRHELANLFCQLAADPARTLRLSLSRLRRALPEGALADEGDAVRLNHDTFQTDFGPFQQLLGSTRWSTAPLETLAEIVPLYQSEFLEGLHLPDAPEFEMWLVGQRSYWRQLYERGALAWLERLVAGGSYQQAIPVAQRLLQQNPLLEEAHYHLVWLYAHTGRRQAALAQFAHCQTILREELAVEPSPDLQTLHAEVEAGRLGHLRAVTAPKQPLARAPSRAPDFVGREAEWQQLNDAWNDARQGKGRVVLITGEAGGGKTRLVREWAQQLPAGAFLYGPCYESTRSLAYHPWITLLEQHRQSLPPAALHTLPAPWLAALARLLPGMAQAHSAAPVEDQGQFFAAVRALLDLAPQALLLFLDDWQWADSASLQLLHYLVERETPVLVAGAYRQEEAEDNPVLLTLLHDLGRRQDILRLPLPPLSPAAVAQLMSHLWPELPAGYREPHLRDRLIQATGGNPLFVNEIVRELAGSSELPQELPVPPSLREIIRRRLHQLPFSGRQVLESLSILDQPAGFDLARQVSGRSEEETLAALELGLRWRLLVSSDDRPSQISFYHDLLGLAVREQLTAIRRQLLHKRAAETLSQQRTSAATLTYHWAEAGDRLQEARYAAEAAREAAALHAHQEAVYYWRRALALAQEATQGTELMLPLAESLVVLGQWQEARSLLEEGLELAKGKLQPHASYQAALGALLEYQGAYEAARQHVRAALAFFREHEEWEQVVRLLGYRGRIQWRQGEYDQALASYEEALSYAPWLPNDRPLIRIQNNMGLIYWQQQRYEAAMHHFQQARLSAAAHDHRIALAITLGNIGNIHKDWGDNQLAIGYYEEALALDSEMGNKMGMGRHLGNIGVAHANLGNHDTAIDYYEQALQVDEALGHREGVARHLGNIGNLHYAAGRFPQALTYYARALAFDAELGNRAGVALHVGNMGSLYKLLGTDEAAVACLVYAGELDLALGNRSGLARHLGNMADLLLGQNRLAEALVFCDLAIGLLRIWPQDYHLCWNLWLRARILLQQELYEDALRCLQEAQEMAEAVQRQDVIVACRTLLPRVRVLAGGQTAAVALQQLAALLPATPGLSERAEILYEQWLLDGSPAPRRRVRDAYEALLRQAATAEARRRAEALGASNLPPAYVPPPLPPLLDATALSLDSLLEKTRKEIQTSS